MPHPAFPPTLGLGIFMTELEVPMISILISKGWVKPHGQMGWLDLLLILAGAVLAYLLVPIGGESS